MNLLYCCLAVIAFISYDYLAPTIYNDDGSSPVVAVLILGVNSFSLIDGRRRRRWNRSMYQHTRSKIVLSLSSTTASSKQYGNGNNNIVETDDGGFQRERDPVKDDNKEGLSQKTTKSTTSTKHHTSLFGRKQNHPTTYEEHPSFKGPLILPRSSSTSDARQRIGRYYKYNNNKVNNDNNDNNNSTSTSTSVPPPQILSPNSSTKTILKRILEQLSYKDAPVDAKEVAESIEFYLRTYKRLLKSCASSGGGSGSSSTTNNNNNNNDNNNIITVYDMCSGHGLTGMLFAACNPPSRGNNKKEQKQKPSTIIRVVLLDQIEPPCHKILKDCIIEICPWIATKIDSSSISDEGNSNSIQFVEATLDEFKEQQQQEKQTKEADDVNASLSSIVISTHACGMLTDRVIDYCCCASTPTNNNNNDQEQQEQQQKNKVSGLAVMPCCYTGTDFDVPYGIKRILGVSMSADIRRCFKLQEAGYHVDFNTIPSEITPMNRIIIGENK
jgi:hypothetical protein